MEVEESVEIMDNELHCYATLLPQDSQLNQHPSDEGTPEHVSALPPDPIALSCISLISAGYEPAGYEPAGYGPAGYEPAGYEPADYGPAGYEPAGYELLEKDL